MFSKLFYSELDVKLCSKTKIHHLNEEKVIMYFYLEKIDIVW